MGKAPIPYEVIYPYPKFMLNNDKLGPGVYALIFKRDQEKNIPTGRLGDVTYPAGWYAYVGSARRGISGRIRHHLNIPHKRPHWHIDHLLPHGRLEAIVAIETDQNIECLLANHLAKRFHVIPKFGSSDCGCKGHLFHAKSRGRLLEAIGEIREGKDVSPK